MKTLISLAAADCQVTEEWVQRTLLVGPDRVKLLKIAKRNSTAKRIISRPSAELEVLQRWLTLRFFNHMEIHPSAMAFRANHSIFRNAKTHQSSKYFVRIDFADFFHSLTATDFFSALEKIPNTEILINEDESRRFIKRTCFNNMGQLPIGYISSPVISNIVMKEFDKTVSRFINENIGTLGNGIYTRYADDVIFSTDIKGACNAFFDGFINLLATTTSPQLTVNNKKTIYSSKAGGSAMVTGLRICHDNHITVTRQYKDQIRLMLSLHEKQKLPSDEIASLRGHLSYVRTVAPTFFSKICAKYVTTIEQIIR